MATEHEASDTGAGIGPQTPAARRRVRSGVPQDPGAELAALEESAAETGEIHAGPAPASPAAGRVPPPEAAPAAPPASKPAAPFESEPAAPIESEPAAPIESEPAAPFESEPAAPIESEPGAPFESEPASLSESAPGSPVVEPPPAMPLDPAPASPLDPSPAMPLDPPPASPPEPPPAMPLDPPPASPPGAHPAAPGGSGPAGGSRRSSTPASRPARTGERAAALLALGSAVGVLLFFALSLGSSGSPVAGLGDFGAEPSRRVVAPGGWIALTGSDAPEGTGLLLETRTRDGDWRTAGQSTTDDDGQYRLEGRVLARPGPLTLRARAPGVGTSTPVTVGVRPLRLASVGDINLGDAPGAAIAANGPRFPWTSVGRALRRADIAFGNLECAVSVRGEPFPKQFTFRGTPAALKGLRRHSGIDVLNLANNHVGDFGREATVDTVRAVEGLGMRAVGAGPDLRRALAPQVVERLGLRVAFVGFSSIAPLEFAAGDDSPGTAWASAESIARAVRAARRKADVVVATFHWGIERATFESAEQRLLAQAAAAAGAQLVIGAHPHVLQPIRREGAALVAYSLGNFVFGAGSTDTTATGILEAGLTADGVASARWRAGRIASARPVLESRRPRRLPVRDREAMAAGISL
jgi:poly-gamma-glutamate capsule biosynthesis protein CapA/YwtB (metallophosphatase superfamily)